MKGLIRTSRNVIASLSIVGFAGCSTYFVIESEKEVIPLTNGQTFQVEHNGWFVPDATWMNIERELADKVIDER